MTNIYRSLAHGKCTVAVVHNLSVQVFPTVGLFIYFDDSGIFKGGVHNDIIIISSYQLYTWK